MNCYRCKKKDLKSAVRVMMPAKNAREKDNFRNICDDCYPVIMQEKGYSLINGVWHSKYSRPTQRAVDGGQAGDQNGQVALPTATNA